LVSLFAAAAVTPAHATVMLGALDPATLFNTPIAGRFASGMPTTVSRNFAGGVTTLQFNSGITWNYPPPGSVPSGLELIESVKGPAGGQFNNTDNLFVNWSITVNAAGNFNPTFFQLTFFHNLPSNVPFGAQCALSGRLPVTNGQTVTGAFALNSNTCQIPAGDNFANYGLFVSIEGSPVPEGVATVTFQSTFAFSNTADIPEPASGMLVFPAGLATWFWRKRMMTAT
jgi:hypothetical protein